MSLLFSAYLLRSIALSSLIHFGGAACYTTHRYHVIPNVVRHNGIEAA